MDETVVTISTVVGSFTDLEVCDSIKGTAWSCENGDLASIDDIFEDAQNIIIFVVGSDRSRAAWVGTFTTGGLFLILVSRVLSRRLVDETEFIRLPFVVLVTNDALVGG